MNIKGVFFSKLYCKLCNFNRELNQTDSCITLSVHHPGDIGTCPKLCMEVQHWADTSIAVAKSCVFFRNWSHTFFSGTGFMPLIGS